MKILQIPDQIFQKYIFIVASIRKPSQRINGSCTIPQGTAIPCHDENIIFIRMLHKPFCSGIVFIMYIRLGKCTKEKFGSCLMQFLYQSVQLSLTPDITARHFSFTCPQVRHCRIINDPVIGMNLFYRAFQQGNSIWNKPQRFQIIMYPIILLPVVKCP